ncbi:MAG: hypothetical protein RL138_1117 [Bacteroidota bacterium]|jgi:pyridoxamine 5'-phosphate oxidase
MSSGEHMDLRPLRQDYEGAPLRKEDCAASPFVQFQLWWTEAQQAGEAEPNAMTLATADQSGQPHARVVLLKALENQRFVFFTNYASDKGREIEQNPLASLSFYFQKQFRQIRIEGRLEQISAADSDTYFYSRPKDSQIGAMLSPQSHVIPNREFIVEGLKELNAKIEAGSMMIQRPAHWGGYALIAHRIEFWQGQPSRLHDRISYHLENNNWIKQRLAP